mgnify:CR=1 FL=1
MSQTILSLKNVSIYQEDNLIVSDINLEVQKGEFLYFDKEGNPSTKSDARIATFRIPVMEKTKNNRGMYVYNKETAIKVPSQEQMDKNGIFVCRVL